MDNLFFLVVIIAQKLVNSRLRDILLFDLSLHKIFDVKLDTIQT